MSTATAPTESSTQEKNFSPFVRQFLDYLRHEKHFSDYTVKSYGADLIQFGQFLTGEIGQLAGAKDGVHKPGELRLLKGDTGKIWGDGTGWLIIDDLVDTGRTAKYVREMLPKAHFATIYAKPAGRPLVDTFVTEVSQDTWIYFPWDIEPQFVQPIAKMRQS